MRETQTRRALHRRSTSTPMAAVQVQALVQALGQALVQALGQALGQALVQALGQVLVRAVEHRTT